MVSKGVTLSSRFGRLPSLPVERFRNKKIDNDSIVGNETRVAESQFIATWSS